MRIDSAVVAGLGVPGPVPLPVPVPFHLNRFNDLDTFQDERKSGPKSKSRTVAIPRARVARITPGPGIATVPLSLVAVSEC